MPSVETEVPHQLDRQEATDRIKAFAEEVCRRYQDRISNLEQSWNGDTLTFGFKTYGFTIRGSLTVAADAVKLSGHLPFTAMMFKGKIEEAIHRELGAVLAPA